MKELFSKINEKLSKNEAVIMATITASSGSVPRGMGARMLVDEGGRLCGTVGGGAVEYRSIEMAKGLLANKESCEKEFLLKKNDIEDIGMICGGDVRICFNYIDADDANKRLFGEAIRMINDDEEAYLIMNLSHNSYGQLSLYGKTTGFIGEKVDITVFNDRPYVQKIGESAYFVEKIVESGYVYIFGGGHVSQALVPVLASVGFKCIVLEDRKEFIDPKLFGDKAKKTMLIDYSRINEYVSITENDYVCIMTRGHKDDTITQAQILKTKAYYIGVIGSARKKSAVFATLKNMGITDDELSRVITPIGLDIKGDTPAEIAISIAAQMIEKRAKKC